MDPTTVQKIGSYLLVVVAIALLNRLVPLFAYIVDLAVQLWEKVERMWWRWRMRAR